MSRRAASTLQCWCAVHQGERHDWIHPHTVRRTKNGARDAYLAIYDPVYLKNPGKLAEVMARIRIEKCTVTLGVLPQ